MSTDMIQNSHVGGGQKALLTLSENGELLFALLLAFFLNAAVRMIEYGSWQSEWLFIGNEPLMATHDAYAWLAGAKGVGAYAVSRFASLIRYLHEFTDFSLGTIGFWLPVATVPWVAIPICLLARSVRQTEAGVVFSLMAGSSIGFLVRTRLGFCDTDLVSLFFPVAFTCVMVVWLSSVSRSTWRSIEVAQEANHIKSAILAVLAGALGAVYRSFYPQGGSVVMAIFALAVVLGVLLSTAGRRVRLWAMLLMIASVTFGGWTGFLLACGVGYALVLRPELFERAKSVPLMLALSLVVFYIGGMHILFLDYLRLITIYAKLQPVDIVSNSSPLQLPAIAQSVREAQNLPWGEVMGRIAGNSILFVIGVAGYCFAVYRRPQLLLFLPFLALGLASVQLGNRFAMFGGVALGAGFGFGLAELMRMLGQNQGRRWIFQLLLCCAVFWPPGKMMREMQPVPVLPKQYAQTFLDLRDKTPLDARLWQWWDYGYAGQYYAERVTFADGGVHDGPWLYPLGRIHAAQSAREASQLMQFVTLAQRNASQQKNPASYYWGSPVAAFEAMGAQNASAFVDNLAVADIDFPDDLPPQYFVVSWENLRLSGWISYYGNWDLVSGTSIPGNMQRLQGEIRIDSVTGALLLNGKPIPIDRLDVVEEKGTAHYEWPNGSGSHVLINQFARQVFLMDAKMYNSMMVQMLIADPRSFEPHFELVDDKYPWTRVYKAKG